MKGKLILLLILTYTAICRLFFLNSIPPLVNSSLNARLFSTATSVGSTIIIFFLTKNYLKKKKIALLSAWFFTNLPWVFEQGRIVSPPNNALFLILLIFLLVQKLRARFKYIFLLLIFPTLYFVYPQFWLFRLPTFKFSINSFMTNLFILTSFDLLFFKNITFWWGGIKEFGIMFLSFAPFFVLGLYQLIINKRKILALLILITFIAALSPFFPESREFYLATPIISLTVAWGIYSWSLQKNMLAKIIIVWLFMFMIYEFSQYLHFYYIHYPQEIMSNFPKIHEAF